MSKSASSATDFNASGIAEARVPASPPTWNPPVHTAAFCRANLLSFSCRIARSKIPARCQRTKAMEPRDIIGESYVQKIFPSSDLYVTLDRYLKLEFTWNLLDNQTGTREQFLDDYLYRLEIKRPFLVNNRRIRCKFVVNQQAWIQFSAVLTVINLLSQTSMKFVLLMYLPDDYLHHKHPLQIQSFWKLMNREELVSLITAVTHCYKVINMNMWLQAVCGLPLVLKMY